MTKKTLACLALMSLSLATAAENAITLNSNRNVRVQAERGTEAAEMLLTKLLPKAITLNADSEDVVTIRLGAKALADECKLPTLESEEFMIAFPDDKTTVWCAAIDQGMNEHKYIVPGFVDAGDLCFGDKI